MTFGLTSAPIAFISLMKEVFKPFLHSLLIVLIDEILVYSRNKVEHVDHLPNILGVLRKQRLYAKFSKSDFWLNSVVFLGHVVLNEWVLVDRQKIEVVKNWVRPSFVTKIRSFVGLASYYRRFVKKFTSIAIDLTNMTKRGYNLSGMKNVRRDLKISRLF